MAVITPPVIDSLPPPPDPNNRLTFNALAYPWSVAQQTLATQLGDVALNVAHNANETYTNASAAASDAADAVAAAATASAAADTCQAITDSIETAISEGPVISVNGKFGIVSLLPADIGLGNVNNTSDINKPVSTAQQAALNTKLTLAQVQAVALCF